jgi:hypothetical protein
VNAIDLKRLFADIVHGLTLDGYGEPGLPGYMLERLGRSELEKSPASLESMFGGLYTKSLVNGEDKPWN